MADGTAATATTAATTATAATNPATPAAPAQPAAPATRPGTISADEFHRLSPEVQSQYANLSGGRWIERAKLETEPPDPSKAAAAPSGDGKATVAEDGRLKIGSLVLSDADIQQIMTEAGAREARKATMPADAASYALDLPADFQLPQGMEWKWAPTVSIRPASQK
jgi:hypothetical protein